MEGWESRLTLKVNSRNRKTDRLWTMTCLHCLLDHLYVRWKHPFPTRKERRVWRICTVTMAVSGLGFTEKLNKPKDDRKRMTSWLLLQYA